MYSAARGSESRMLWHIQWLCKMWNMNVHIWQAQGRKVFFVSKNALYLIMICLSSQIHTLRRRENHVLKRVDWASEHAAKRLAGTSWWNTLGQHARGLPPQQLTYCIFLLWCLSFELNGSILFSSNILQEKQQEVMNPHSNRNCVYSL